MVIILSKCIFFDKELGDDQEGELLFRGPSIMKGYLNNPKANAETFTSDGWMRTGDVGKYESASGEFFIVDRIKELIKFKGFQVAPAGKSSIRIFKI
jgi:long-subunit acyl-CoA synthetase (AMP-forming)